MQCYRFLVRALPVLQLRLAFCEFGYIRLSQFEDHFLNSKNQKAKFCSSLSVRLLNKFLFLQRLYDLAQNNLIIIDIASYRSHHSDNGHQLIW